MTAPHNDNNKNKKNQKNISMDEFKFHPMFFFGARNCHVWLGIDLSHELLMNIARFLAHAKEKNLGIAMHRMHCMRVHLWSKHIAAVRTAA